MIFVDVIILIIFAPFSVMDLDDDSVYPLIELLVYLPLKLF